MLTVRRAADRGYFDFGWLKTRHSFSFGEYRDPKHMGFRTLRVINEDWVAPGEGFDTHPHQDMEILTFVLEGSVEHRDSMGNGSVIYPGDIQRMTAGTGVTHSERNPSPTEPLHLLQIWIRPEVKGLAPGYEQKKLLKEAKTNQLCLIASGRPPAGVVKIHQSVNLWVCALDLGRSVEQGLAPGRHGWIQVIRGSIKVGRTVLEAGDGAAVSEESLLTVRAESDSEFLFFDLA